MASYSQYSSPLRTASFALRSVFKKLNSGASVWTWTKLKGKLGIYEGQTQASAKVKQLAEVSGADQR